VLTLTSVLNRLHFHNRRWRSTITEAKRLWAAPKGGRGHQNSWVCMKYVCHWIWLCMCVLWYKWSHLHKYRCVLLYDQNARDMYTYTYVHAYVFITQKHICSHTDMHFHTFVEYYTWNGRLVLWSMGWLRLVGSLKLKVYFAKEPNKRDDFLPKRPVIWRSLLLVSTPYTYMPHLARLDRALSGMCAHGMTCLYILYHKAARLEDMNRCVCIFGRAMCIIPMSWETSTGKHDVNYVMRQLCVSSIICFVNYSI